MSKRPPAIHLFAILIFVVLSAPAASGQQPVLTPQNSNTNALLIAVSPVDENVVWAAGTNSTFVVTTDGGNTWRSGIVPTETGGDLQFRDVQGVSAQVAYLLSIGNFPGDFRIYKTQRRRRDLDIAVQEPARSAPSTIALPFGLPPTGLRIAIR